MRAFIASVVVAFVLLSALADSGATNQRVVTGTVVRFQAGEWMSVANEATDPMGFQLTLRETTLYEGRDSALGPAITTGARVTVWYRSVAERRPVADKVRVLSGGTPR